MAVLGKLSAAVLAIGLAVVLIIAATGGGKKGDKSSFTTVSQVKPDLTNADPRLDQIYAKANQLLPGGVTSFDAQLRSLKGLPVVVNKWASWCGPCQFEFPALQRSAKRYGGKVAFIGINSDDSNSNALGFLKTHPVPYPSYSDPNLKIADSLKTFKGFPTTAFFNAAGKMVHVQSGPYATSKQFDADLAKYARPQ